MKKTLILTLIILVSLSLGILIGTKIKKTSVPQGSPANTENTYQAGWDAAKARLAQSPMGRIASSGMEIKNISGSISKIDGNKLTVKIALLDPLSDPALDVRTIDVDANTKFSLNVQKDPAQFQKEMQDFQDKMKTRQAADQSQPQAPIVPPMPFDQKSINLSDLKVDQQISIVAGQDIKNTKEFVATEVNVQEAIPAPAPAPVETK